MNLRMIQVIFQMNKLGSLLFFDSIKFYNKSDEKRVDRNSACQYENIHTIIIENQNPYNFQ